MPKGKLLGRGLSAEVYEWGEDKVLKLFFSHFSDERIKYEADTGKIIYEAGIPSPAVFDIVNVGRRKGIIYQRIFGKSMLRYVEREPWNLSNYVIQIARLQFKIHKYSAERLTPQKQRLKLAIKDSAKILGNKQKKIIDYLESLPTGNSVCHGDLHFKNVIISQNDMIAIDWNNAYKGNPLGDVVRTCMMISSPALLFTIPSIITEPYMFAKSILCKKYLNEYMRLANVSFENIDAWVLPVVAARLREKIPGEKKWLMNIINKRLR